MEIRLASPPFTLRQSAARITQRNPTKKSPEARVYLINIPGIRLYFSFLFIIFLRRVNHTLPYIAGFATRRSRVKG